MKTYVIERAHQAVPLCGGTDDGPWKQSNVALIGQFPWHKAGRKQGTAVRLLYDDQALYAQFLAEDTHIYSETTELNGSVCRDSCVELFATIEPQRGPDYFNFEANCCGVFHLGWGPGRGERKLVPADLAAGIELATSVPGPTRDESPDDQAWWLAARIPFDVIGRLSGRTVSPASGDVWKGNFYRCGGKTDQQFACWNAIATPGPDFHQPEHFGTLRFA